MAPPNPSSKYEKIEFRGPESLRDGLDRVAYEQSSPGNTVNRSDVLREAAREYIRKHDRNPGELHPDERGSLDADFESLWGSEENEAEPDGGQLEL